MKYIKYTNEQKNPSASQKYDVRLFDQFISALNGAKLEDLLSLYKYFS